MEINMKIRILKKKKIKKYKSLQKSSALFKIYKFFFCSFWVKKEKSKKNLKRNPVLTIVTYDHDYRCTCNLLSIHTHYLLPWIFTNDFLRVISHAIVKFIVFHLILKHCFSIIRQNNFFLHLKNYSHLKKSVG